MAAQQTAASESPAAGRPTSLQTLATRVSALLPARVRHHLPRVAHYARWAWGFVMLTPVGLTILLAALWAGWYQGVAHLDLVVLMVSFCALVALVLMAGFTLVGFFIVRSLFKKNLGRTNTTLEAEALSATGWWLRLPFWLPFLDVTWTWEGGEGACAADLTLHLEGQDTHELATPRRRGVFHRIVRRVQVRDILGLTRIFWRIEEAVDLEVLPHRGKIEHLVPLMGFISGDDISDPYGDPWGDRVDMRQYSPGDSPRMILWKVFARSRKLMVRIPERAVAARPRGCGYLVADRRPNPLDEPSAGVARVMIERQLLGEGWAFAADNGGAPATTVEDALGVLARSGQGGANSGGFRDFIEKAEREGYGYCVVFVPPAPGPWLDTLIDGVRHTSLRIHAFIGMDGIDAGRLRKNRHGGLVRRLFVQPDDLDAPTLPELSEVLTRLAACGGNVALIDRRTGQLFSNPASLLGKTGGASA